MADTKTCDRCGKTPAHRVEVSVAMWDVAEADQPTATMLGADSCAADQESTVQILFEHAVAMLREQAPLHAKAVKARDRRDVAENAMRSIRPALEAQRAAAAANPEAKVEDALTKREAELTEEIAAAETERVNILTQGTKSSDAIVAKMHKALRGKGK